MDADGARSATPSLLPILRSQQQAEILPSIMGAPDDEFSVADLGRRTGAPYFGGLSAILVRAFPSAPGTALADIEGIERAYLFGSWTARFTGHDGRRTVNDEGPFHHTVTSRPLVPLDLDRTLVK